MNDEERVLVVGDSRARAMEVIASPTLEVRAIGGARLPRILRAAWEHLRATTTVLIIIAFHNDLTEVQWWTTRAPRVMLPRVVEWQSLVADVREFRRQIAANYPRLLVIWTLPSVPDFLRYNTTRNLRAGRELQTAGMEVACHEYSHLLRGLHLRLRDLGSLAFWDWATMSGGPRSRRTRPSRERGWGPLRFHQEDTTDGLHPNFGAGRLERWLREQLDHHRRVAQPARPRVVASSAGLSRSLRVPPSRVRASPDLGNLAQELREEGARAQASLTRHVIGMISRDALRQIRRRRGELLPIANNACDEAVMRGRNMIAAGVPGEERRELGLRPLTSASYGFRPEGSGETRTRESGAPSRSSCDAPPLSPGPLIDLGVVPMRPIAGAMRALSPRRTREEEEEVTIAFLRAEDPRIEGIEQELRRTEITAEEEESMDEETTSL